MVSEGAGTGRVAALGARLRAVSQLHEHPAAVAWWAARIAPVAAWLDAPRRRRLLALVAVAVGTSRLARSLKGAPAPAWAAIPLVFGLLYSAYLVGRRFHRLPEWLRRRPQVALHAVFLTAVAAVWAAPPGAGRRLLAVVGSTLTFLIWRLGYLLKTAQRGRAAETRFADHLLYLWPAWGGTNTPYGKGLDYLARHEATTAEAFARSQLAGLKLLVLSLVWRGLTEVMRAAVYGERHAPLTPLLHGYTLGIPHLAELVRHPGDVPLLAAWASLYLDLVWVTLRLATKGHRIIGYLRLCGFNVFRNTYKPLLAESVVEFWNRYYYYFKELLVEFFFFPTFARRLRRRPRLRLLAAIFMAAFVGNLYYHAIEQPAFLAGNLQAVWAVLHCRVLYCFLLAIGIGVSMLREQRRRGLGGEAARGGARRIVRIAGVWTFFSLIHVWGLPGTGAGFTDRVRFLLSLAGV